MSTRGFARVLSQPQPGFYTIRLAKNGPLVDAVIWLPCPLVPTDGDADPDDWCRPLDRPRLLRAEVAGEAADVAYVWQWARKRISQSEFNYLRADRAWAQRHAPDDPRANPRRPIDPMTAPIPDF